jgi:anti-sigma factor (TIGR02949 family)
MEISCREVRQELANYVEDDVTEDLQWRIERHFSTCDGCSALYDGLRKIVYLVGKSDLIELPVGLSERLYRRLHMGSANSAI